MIIKGFRLEVSASRTRNDAWGAVDRPEDPGGNPRVSSGHVLSETAGAALPLGTRGLIPSRDSGAQGACIDGEDRIFNRRSSGAGGGLRFEPSVRRWASPNSGGRRKWPRRIV